MTRRFRLPLLVAALIGATVAAHAEWSHSFPTDGTVSVRASSLFEKIPSVGYLPITFTIENGSEAELTYDLSANTQSGHSQNQSISSTSSRLRVPGNQRASATLLTPITVTNQGTYRTAAVQVFGPHLDGNGKASFPGGGSSGKATTFTAMSSALSLRSWSPLQEQAKKNKTPLSGSIFEPSKIPTHWRGLSGVTLLWITADEFDALLPAQRTTVEDWVRLGGQLFWVVQKTSTRSLTEFGAPSSDELTAPLGLGTISFRQWDGRELPPDETLTAINKVSDRAAEQINSGYAKRWRLADNVGGLRFPVTLLVIFITLFAITIGPLNLFWFARSGRRHRLFWTTPLISLVASGLLVAIILLQDGTGASGQRITFARLLPDSNQMIIRQEQVSRSGLLLDRAFTLAEPALVAPLVIHDQANATRQFRQDDENLSGDWFSSRSVQAQYLEALVPTRARVELLETQPDGTPTLLSSVPHTLDTILYVDAEGRRWQAGPLRPGEKLPLIPATQEQFSDVLTVPAAGPLVSSAWTSQRGTRNVFYATATKGPTLATLPAVRWKHSQNLLTGPVTKR
ncbi:MAG: hypothetical protein WA771_15495 [Chthoniobacterales bacterium]